MSVFGTHNKYFVCTLLSLGTSPLPSPTLPGPTFKGVKRKGRILDLTHDPFGRWVSTVILICLLLSSEDRDRFRGPFSVGSFSLLYSC